jgi:hypothetical protein
MSVFHIDLEACNPGKGHHRAYRIEAGRDLFGHWLVEIRFGRIGTAGRALAYSAPDEGGARRIVRQCLRRRSTAPRRIGIPYRIRALRDPQGFMPVNCRS